MIDPRLPLISYDALMAKLSDPGEDLAHYLQYMIELHLPGRMAPELEPNPSLVTDIPPRPEGGAIISLANSFMRNRRHRAYRKRIRSGWSGPRIVSEGDSWFQYPTTLQDTIDHLMKDHAILSLGAAGDELSDIEEQREILLHLKRENASALLLSAGGNDLFDGGQIARLIEDPFVGAKAADLVGPIFDAFLQQMMVRFLRLFRRVHTALPHVHILIHGYAPAFPRNGAWIEKPLRKRGLQRDMQHAVIKLIVKRFNDALAGLSMRSEFNGKVAHIDVTKIGGNPNDWHDEIHLDGKNSAKVAAKFRAELKKRLGQPQPESGVAETAEPEMSENAARLTALGEDVLLRELDLRVSLLDMDPSVAENAHMPLLVIGRPAPEGGVPLIGAATRRLIGRWERELHDLICGDGRDPENRFEDAILDVVADSRATLAGAIAGWLVTGPLAVPAILASALAAWLAGRAQSVARETLCTTWMIGGDAPVEPPHPPMGISVSSARARMKTPQGAARLTADDIKQKTEILTEQVAKKVVEVPSVPVDAEQAEAFVISATNALELLGAEPDDVDLPATEDILTEAFIFVDGTRPALYVRDGFVDLDEPTLEDGGWAEHIKDNEVNIRTMIAATGRVIRGFDRSPDRVYGTAWLLEDGTVATAKHVVEGIARRNGNDWHMNGDFFVDFSVEEGREPDLSKIIKIGSVAWASDGSAARFNASQLDAARLTLEPFAGQTLPDPVVLGVEADGAVMLDGALLNVGHPAAPRGRWLSRQEDGNPDTVTLAIITALVGDKFGVKRLSPGLIDFKPGASEGDTNGHIFTHDATTLGGSSGSPIMTLGNQSGAMMGLHFAGKFRTRNYAHWIPAISSAWA